MQLTEENIEAFWNWFVSVADQYIDHYSEEDIYSTLDDRIRLLGDFTWEIGPDAMSPQNTALVISPGGNLDLLPLSKRIISSAPHLTGWEFHSSKPPKQWKRRFKLRHEDTGSVEINASGWRYALLQYPDNTFDMIIKAPDISHYDEDMKSDAAEIVVESEIGEENRLVWIKDIEVVDEFDETLVGKDNSIDVFSRHFRSLISRADKA